MSLLKKLSIKNQNVYYKYLISYSLSSIIPLLIIVYFSFQYILPFVNFTKPLHISPDEIRIFILLALLCSILGFYLSLDIIRSINILAERTKSISGVVRKEKEESPMKLRIQREDEIGIISTNIELLVEQIRAQFLRLNYLVEEVEYSRHALEESTEKLVELSIIDEATGLFSANYIYIRLDDEIKRAEYFKQRFAFVLASINNVENAITKEEKENFLDTAIKNLGEIICSKARAIDIVGRAGVNKVAIIAPSFVEKELLSFIEDVGNEFENMFSLYIKQGLTLSFGGAIYPESGKTKENLVEKSVEMLSLAQKKETKRICIDSLTE